MSKKNETEIIFTEPDQAEHLKTDRLWRKPSCPNWRKENKLDRRCLSEDRTTDSKKKV
jgi:hypothetical protein